MAVDLMIVGSQKSGTTSLLDYLGRHPGISTQIRREMTWFVEPDQHVLPFPERFYFGDGDWDGQLRLGKLAGLMYHPEAVARLHEHNPRVQAIAILRDPVARAYSAFWFARQRGREPLESFEEAIAAERNPSEDERTAGYSYLEWSRYASYVEHLQQTLGRDSVHVVILEEFLRDPKSRVLAVTGRVGLDPAALGAEVPAENTARRARSDRVARFRRRSRAAHAAKRLLPRSARESLRRQYRRLNEVDLRPPPMAPTTDRALRDLFAQPNRELEALLGRPIEMWRHPPG